MFTGIVDHVGSIQKTTPTEKGLTLEISTRFENFALGESISVDGACLTVIRSKTASFEVELSPETHSLTVSGGYQVGSRVNLERALAVGDRFGGHWVSGHVDQTALLLEKSQQGDFFKMTFTGVAPANRSFLSSKGSITVNGVSLTVNRVLEEGFEVMLIPHTLERTNLQSLEKGSKVNLEFDLLAKLVVNETRRYLESTNARV